MSLAEAFKAQGGATAFVYIAEAHALNEWPLRSKLAMTDGKEAVVEEQHTTTAERCAAARKMLHDLGRESFGDMQVLVDDLDAGEVFSKTLSPWPTRFFVVELLPMEINPPRVRLLWASRFEADAGIDFAKISKAVLGD